MKVTRKSLFSGNVHTMELPVTLTEVITYFAGTANIQDIFPHLTDEQREFIKSGITPEEWAEHVAAVEEPDDDEEGLAEGGEQ